MMKATLNTIRSFSPCAESWKKLLAHFGKTEADDTEVDIMDIIDILGVDDALWALRAVEGHDREIHLLAVSFARRVQHKMRDPRSLNAMDVAERYANGQATKEELKDAYLATYMEACGAAYGAADLAAYEAAYEAAYRAAYWGADKAAVASDDSEAERAWQGEELRRVCQAIEVGQDPYPKHIIGA